MSGKIQSVVKALALLLALSAPALAQSTISTWSVTHDTTLTKANGPYIVNGTITVVDTVTLTIEAGAELKFADAKHLQVNGSLQAIGTENEPIVFTSSKTNPFDGRWEGIVINGSSSVGLISSGIIPQTRIEWCTIGFGTSDQSSTGLVYVHNDASPSIINTTIHNSRVHGLDINSQYIRVGNTGVAAGPEIRNNTFRANSWFGLKLRATYSRGSKMIDLAEEVPRLITGNTFEGNGSQGSNNISLGQMTLARSYTWAKIDSQDAQIENDISVQRFDRDGDEVELTVPAGTRIEFSANGGMRFEGKLQAVGTAEAPIEFVGDAQDTDWDGLYFNGGGAVASLEHCVIRQADKGLAIFNSAPVTVRNSRILDSRDYAIHVDSAEPTIENNELSNLASVRGTGIWVSDFRTIPTIKDNTVQGFNFPLWLDGTTTTSDDRFLDPADLSKISGNTFQDNTRQWIVLEHAQLTADYTWGAIDEKEVRIENYFRVPGNRTLTVLPGTRIRFRDGARMEVWGTLNAVGTESEPIEFTTSRSLDGDPERGHWSVGIRERGASASKVEWCEFVYGGGISWNSVSDQGLLYVEDSAPTIRNSTFRLSRYSGISINAQYIDGDGTFNGPTVENNTFIDNGSFGLVLGSRVRSKRIDLSYVDNFISNNTFQRNGELSIGFNNSIALHDMTTEGDYTWGTIDGQALDLIGDVTVPRFNSNGDPAKLTIPAGMLIELGDDPQNNTDGQFVITGEMEAIGTADDPIVFRSIEGHNLVWTGLDFVGSHVKGRIEHCVFRDLGDTDAAIFVGGGADVEVRNTVFRDTYRGVYTNESTPLIEDCEFRSLAEDGIYAINAAFIPRIKNNRFIDIDSQIFQLVEGILNPADLENISGNHYELNHRNHIVLENLSIGEDYVWQNTIDSMRVTLDEQITIPRDVTLTVPAGSELPFWTRAYLNVIGTIEAVGTEAAPIHFTSAFAPDANTGAVRRAWYGVAINGRSNLSSRQAGSVPESRFEWCVFSNGDGWAFSNLLDDRNGGNGLLNIGHASPILRNVIFRNSDDAGLYAVGGQTVDANGDTASTAMPVIDGVQFLDSRYGMTLRNSMPQISNSTFLNNSDWGVQNVGDLTVDASGSWWGSAAGPTHASNAGGNGQKVTDNVLFADWLQEAPGPVAKPRPDVAGLVGDVDGNGRVSIRDALIAAAYALDAGILLPSGADIARGDVDGDGRVSLRDALVIATYVVDPDNDNLPPYIATKPAALIAGELERGDRVKLLVAPDAETRGYSLHLEWDERDLVLVGYDEPAAISEQPGQLILADLGTGALQPVVLEFEAQRRTNGAMRQYVDALTSDLSPGVVEVQALVPQRFALEQNHPNPFNPSTTIRYALPADADVTLKIFNLQGQTVRTLVSGAQAAGIHQIQWDGRADNGRGVGAGLYFYALEAGDRRAVHKMLLLK